MLIRFLTLATFLVLTACGGGGGGSSSTVTGIKPPTGVSTVSAN